MFLLVHPLWWRHILLREKDLIASLPSIPMDERRRQDGILLSSQGCPLSISHPWAGDCMEDKMLLEDTHWDTSLYSQPSYSVPLSNLLNLFTSKLLCCFFLLTMSAVKSTTPNSSDRPWYSVLYYTDRENYMFGHHVIIYSLSLWLFILEWKCKSNAGKIKKINIVASLIVFFVFYSDQI